MKIAIIGSRGIPNYYGGFEECAQQIGTRLVKRGHEVFVYSSHNHPYSQKEYEGVQIIHKYDPEHRLGTFGQFIYDLNAIVDARWRKYDVIILLGYTSSSLWWWLYPKKSIILNNMDGIEWRRNKYSNRVKWFLKKAEKWAAHNCHVMIADALAIQDYLNDKYKRGAVFIPYGAQAFKDPNPEILGKYNVEAFNYNLVIARLEPENNIEIILSGVQKSETDRICLIIGNHNTDYGEFLKSKYKDSRIRFVKASYKKEDVDNLRFHSHIYFHGHSVGGTNPSLLEAMACKSVICAHDNRYNREVLGENGNYFLDMNDIATSLDFLDRQSSIQKEKQKNNLERLKNQYNWDIVCEQYEVVMQQTRL